MRGACFDDGAHCQHILSQPVFYVVAGLHADDWRCVRTDSPKRSDVARSEFLLFGAIDDSYIERARERGWLLVSDSIATPASTNKTEDLQLRATLEPIRDLKIDLNASRMETVSKSVQYMYAGNPTTQSGTLTMTTISIGTAFESQGNANNGYHSATFEKFAKSLDDYRSRVEARYIGANYPMSMGGGKFDHVWER